MEKISAIYKIQLSDGRCYVGSSRNLNARLKAHKTALSSDKHHSIKLQRAWNKYGRDAFEFSVLEIIENVDNLIKREQYWINKLDSFENGFNVAPLAGSNLGAKHSDAAKAAKSRRQMGHVVSDETRGKIRVANTGRTLSLETRAKISIVQIGKVLSELTKQRMRESRIGLRISDDHKAKLIAANTGRPMPKHVKDAIKLANAGRKQSPESIEKRRIANTGKKRPQSAIDATAAAKRGKPMSLEQRKKLSDALKGRKRDPALVARSAATLRIKNQLKQSSIQDNK